jgi:hypothetical protein
MKMSTQTDIKGSAAAKSNISVKQLAFAAKARAPK